MSAFADPRRTGRRRTWTGLLLAVGVLLGPVDLPGNYPIAAAVAVVVLADVAVGGAVRVRRWISGRVIVLDIGPRDRT